MLPTNEEEEANDKDELCFFSKMQKLRTGRTFYIAGVSWADSKHFKTYQSSSVASLPAPLQKRRKLSTCGRIAADPRTSTQKPSTLEGLTRVKSNKDLLEQINLCVLSVFGVQQINNTITCLYIVFK